MIGVKVYNDLCVEIFGIAVATYLGGSKLRRFVDVNPLENID